MICNLYLTKVLATNHKVESTLTKTGLVTTITFLDINIKVTLISIDIKKNSITLGINDGDWDKLSSHVLGFNQELN